MSAIILLNMDDADDVEIIQEDDTGWNMVFDNAEAADLWLQENAKVGWCTRIIDLDD